MKYTNKHKTRCCNTIQSIWDSLKQLEQKVDKLGGSHDTKNPLVISDGYKLDEAFELVKRFRSWKDKDGTSYLLIEKDKWVQKKEIAEKLKMSNADLNFIKYDICQDCDLYKHDDFEIYKTPFEWCGEPEACYIYRIFKVIEELEETK